MDFSMSYTVYSADVSYITCVPSFKIPDLPLAVKLLKTLILL